MENKIFDGDATDIRERVIWVLRRLAGKPTRYKVLEERLGISARKWQNVCNHAQQPSIEMLEAIGKKYPQYCEWLLTGTTSLSTQKKPALPPKAPGEIDLSVLDEPWEEPESFPSEPNAEMVKEIVEAVFGVVKQKRKSRNDNQGS